VSTRDIKMVEAEGRVRVLRDSRLRSPFNLEAPGQPVDNSKLEKFLEILKPSPGQRAILLQDLSGEIEFEKMALVMELTDLDQPEYDEPASCRASEGRPNGGEQARFADPWDSRPEPKRRTRKRQRVAAVSPLHAIGSAQTPRDAHGAGTVGPATASVDPRVDEALRQQGTRRYQLQLVAVDNDGGEDVIDVALLDKRIERPEHVGLTLAESKTVLRSLQRVIVESQASAYLETRQACDRCGKKLSRKDYQDIALRTMFGNVPLDSPRMKSCDCHVSDSATFQPLRDLLPENTTPELLFMESKWSSLTSYGVTPKVLKDLLPIDDKLNGQTVRNHTMKIARRCERDLERKQQDSTEVSAEREGQTQPPDGHGVFNVGIDGAYLRLWKRRGSKFEILIGRSVPPAGPTKCFGMVHSVDNDPQRRLRELLLAQGMQPGQPVRFMADGDDTLRTIQGELAPDATHILDRFHVTMRLTVLRQYVRGIVKQEKDAGTYAKDGIGHALQCSWTSTKWKLWHGKIDDALERLSTLRQYARRVPATYHRAESFLHMIDDFRRYVVNNRALIPNYGELWRKRLPITTASIESLVCSLIGRRFAKKQQMQWTALGAHLLLQVRTKVANGDLPSTFQRWYSDFPVAQHAVSGPGDNVLLVA